jgi:hypothetical protein
MRTAPQATVLRLDRRPLEIIASKGSASGALSSVGFGIFLLVNATLFVRPAELFPSLEGRPIYEALILLCLLMSLPSLLKELTPAALKRWPVNFCVVALLPAVALSHLVHLHFEPAAADSFSFFKLVVYYMLLVVHLNSLNRLRKFLFVILVCTLVMTTLSVLEYNQLIDVPELSAIHQLQSDPMDAVNTEDGDLARLSSLGIFNNPNDLSRIVVVAMFLCMIYLGERRYGLARYLWGGPVLFLGYANFLTYSRGGFLGLLGGLAVLFLLRYGWIKTTLLGCLVLPVLFAASAGRQTDISLNAETAHQRILLWRDGLVAMQASPVFGTGMNTYPEITGGLVAHNSFVHAFTELGLVGGTLFVGLFYFAISPLCRLQASKAQLASQQVSRLGAFVIAILVSYAIGLLSSSRCYEVPTFLLIGVASAYARLAAARAPGAVPSLTGRTLGRLFGVSLLVLIGHYIFVRLNS